MVDKGAIKNTLRTQKTTSFGQKAKGRFSSEPVKLSHVYHTPNQLLIYNNVLFPLEESLTKEEQDRVAGHRRGVHNKHKKLDIMNKMKAEKEAL
jgi:hypothetical protein